MVDILAVGDEKGAWDAVDYSKNVAFFEMRLFSLFDSYLGSYITRLTILHNHGLLNLVLQIVEAFFRRYDEVLLSYKAI